MLRGISFLMLQLSSAFATQTFHRPKIATNIYPCFESTQKPKTKKRGARELGQMLNVVQFYKHGNLTDVKSKSCFLSFTRVGHKKRRVLPFKWLI